jgi:acetolactate synthase I/II/III large subunit
MLLIGTEAWPWTQQVRRFVDDVACPVMTTYQARGVVPDRFPNAAGVFTNGEIERPLIASADLIITIGLDPVELIPADWAYEAPVVSLVPCLVPDPYFEPTAEVIGPIDESLGALGSAVDAHGWGADEAVEHRRRALESLRIGGRELGPADVVEAIDEVLSGDVTVTVDAGAHMLVAVPMLTINRPRGLLISNGLATMGYAIPAAVAAALARPGEPVVALTGDGGLGMVVSELETIARLDLPVAVVVFNDAALSLIEIKQGPDHGGAGAVRYRDIDFAGVAMAMGMPASRVDERSELDEVLRQIGEGPHLIDVRVDPSSYRHVIRVTRG